MSHGLLCILLLVEEQSDGILRTFGNLARYRYYENAFHPIYEGMVNSSFDLANLETLSGVLIFAIIFLLSSLMLGRVFFMPCQKNMIWWYLLIMVIRFEQWICLIIIELSKVISFHDGKFPMYICNLRSDCTMQLVKIFFCGSLEMTRRCLLRTIDVEMKSMVCWRIGAQRSTT